ncbi:MAG: 50S ribosomal protein L20 [Candidatus Peregrinibacteria bacterium]
MRSTNSVARKARHKKVLKLAKGYKWGRSKLYRLAKNAITKAGQNSYRDRRRKKRDFRQLWISRISAAVQAMGKRYSEFINLMTVKKIIVNRKMLADIAARNPDIFTKIVEKVYA